MQRNRWRGRHRFVRQHTKEKLTGFENLQNTVYETPMWYKVGCTEMQKLEEKGDRKTRSVKSQKLMGNLT